MLRVFLSKFCSSFNNSKHPQYYVGGWARSSVANIIRKSAGSSACLLRSSMDYGRVTKNVVGMGVRTSGSGDG